MGIMIGNANNTAITMSGGWIGDANNIARKIIGGWIGDANNIARSIFAAEQEIVFTASTTYTIPSGVSEIDVFCVGGGGGGGGIYFYDYIKSSTYRYRYYYGSGGGGGYTKTVKSIAVNPGDELTIVVGAGGAGGAFYWYEYYDGDGEHYGTVSSSSSITGGSTGGASSVALNGTTIVSVNGGAGGRKTSTTATNTISSETPARGSAGGTGSSVAYMEYYYDSGSSTTTYCYVPGSLENHDGASGQKACYYKNTSSSESETELIYGTIGEGQGTTTRAWGESNGTLYSSSGSTGKSDYGTGYYKAYRRDPNTGHGGHSIRTEDYMPGGSGIVIIRTR